MSFKNLTPEELNEFKVEFEQQKKLLELNDIPALNKAKENFRAKLLKRAEEKKAQQKANINNVFHLYDVIVRFENENIPEKIRLYLESVHPFNEDESLSPIENFDKALEHHNFLVEKTESFTNSLKEKLYACLEECLVEIEPILKTKKAYKNAVLKKSSEWHSYFLDYNQHIFSLHEIITFEFWHECITEAIENYHRLKSIKTLDTTAGTGELDNKIRNNIIEHFKNIDTKKGYKYAFKYDEDFYTFVDVLTLFFEDKNYTVPELIEIKKGSKTKVAKTLNDIYFDNIRNDIELKHNSKYWDIAQSLTYLKELPHEHIYKLATN